MSFKPMRVTPPSDEQMIEQYNRQSDWLAECFGGEPHYFETLAADNREYHLRLMRVEWSLVKGAPHDMGNCWCGFYHRWPLENVAPRSDFYGNVAVPAAGEPPRG